MSNKFSIIVISAGKGTRMKSKKPKVLHTIANLEMINHVINTAKSLNSKEIVVVVSEENKDPIKQCINDNNIKYVIQEELNGTGGAVKVGLSKINEETDYTLIMYGDECLILTETYQKLIDESVNNNSDINVLAFHTKDIKNKYGRLVTRSNAEVEKIVEYKDAKDSERAITLCNSGILLVKSKIINNLVNRIEKSKVTGEYYLTEIIRIAREDNLKCNYIVGEEDEVMGVNSQEELSIAENIFQNRLRKKFMINGVTLQNPNTIHFSYDTEIQNNTTIYPNVYFGKNVKVGSFVEIKPFSYLENCAIEDKKIIGPFWNNKEYNY